MDEDEDDIVAALRRGEGCWEYAAADEIEALRDENTRLLEALKQIHDAVDFPEDTLRRKIRAARTAMGETE